MASKTSTATAPTVDIDEVTSEVYATRDRIVTLMKEGNADGAKELSAEAEKMISEHLTSRKADVTKAKKTLREAIAEAMRTEPLTTSTEVVAAPKAEVVADESAIDALVKLGAEQVSNISNNTVAGARQLASLMLDLRRRITLPDGSPDLMGDSALAKRKSGEIYKRVLDTLPAEGEYADHMRADIKKLAKDVQNVARDVRVNYAKALDNEGSEDERAKFPFLRADSELSFSEQLAEHYGFKLATQAEIAKANREAKALEAKAKAEPAESSEETSAGEATPVTKLAQSVYAIGKALDVVPEITKTDLADLGAVDVDSLRSDIEQQIARLNAVLAQLKA